MKKRTGINIILLGCVVLLLGIGYYYFTRAVEEEVERPEVAIISPADGTTVVQKVGVVEVKILFTPPQTEKKVRSLKVSLNDIDITSNIVVGGGFARGWVAARPGLNVLQAEVDRGESEAVSKFKVSIVPLPEEPGSDEGEGTEEITAGEEEQDKGVGKPEADGGEEQVPEIVFHPGTDNDIPPAFGGVALPKAGKEPVVLEEKVEETKEGESKEDESKKAPSCPLFITITNPADGSVVDQVEMPVMGRTCPELAVQLFVILHRFGGEEALITRAKVDGNYSFSQVHFRGGDNSIRVVVSDEAGNVAWAESNFKVDEETDEDSSCRFSVWIDCPERQAYAVGEEFTCGVNICFPDANLMVYDMRISYDPSVVNLLNATGGDAAEFGGLVINIQNPPAEGGLAVSPFNGVNNGSTLFNSPSGPNINVGRLTFKAVGAGSSRLFLQCVGLWDTTLKPVPPKGSGDEMVTVK